MMGIVVSAIMRKNDTRMSFLNVPMQIDGDCRWEKSDDDCSSTENTTAPHAA